MRIAFIVDSFPNLSETFILNQITGLLDLGHEVDVFAGRDLGLKHMHADVEAYRLKARTHYFNIPVSKVSRIFKVLGLLLINFRKRPIRLLKALDVFRFGRDALSLRLFYAFLPFIGKEQDYDIIHCHFGPNGDLGIRLRQLGLQGKLVITFHGYDTRLAIKKGAYIYRDLFEHGDCFIAASSYNRRNLVDFGVDPEKIIDQPVGIDLDRFTYHPPHLSVRSAEPVRVLTVARLVEEKGLRYGIQAIRRLLERTPGLGLEYNIIGHGPLKSDLEALIQDCLLSRVIHLLGPRSQAEVVQALQRSDIFLLPSVAESFGVVLLEAQAVGLPVVASSVGGIPQAMVDGKTGFLVRPRDPDALAERLEYLIQHSELWPDMARAGRRFVKENFNIKELNQQLEAIYEVLLAG